MSRLKLAITSVLGAVMLSSLSCARSDQSRSAGTRPNVVVITLDTIRCDRLGAYGNAEIRTEFVDGLAQRGVLFEHCVAPAPLTLPSHTSLFTGTYPVYHGVRDNGSYVVPDEMTTMAELFEAAGYRTGAFVGAFVLSSRWGLDQGFGTYTEPESSFDPTLVSFSQIQRRAGAVIEDAIAWIGTPSDRPFFAWVHLYDPHLPYDPPPEYAAAYPNDPYLGEIAYADAQLQRLGELLDSTDLTSNTLVVFAGDHGEGLGDHGEYDHGLLLYQTTARTPLIIALPGTVTPGVRRPEVVSLVDVLPTVAEASGLELTGIVQGQSLWPLLTDDGDFQERPVYAETYYPKLHFGWSPLTSLQDRQYQYISSSDPELFDLVRDPDQQQNLVTSRPEIAERMSLELDDAITRLGADGLEAGSSPDAATIAKLAALGYVAGNAQTDTDSDVEDLPSPRTMLPLYNRLTAANNAMVAGREAVAEAALTELVSEDADLVDGWISLGRLYRRQGRMAEAAAAFREAHARRPLDPFVVSRLAVSLISAQQMEDADQLLQAAAEQHPDDPYIVFAQARLYEKTGQFPQAEEMFRRSVELDPRSAPAHVRLAALALRRGDLAAAANELDAAQRLDPNVPEASLVRGQLLEAQGRDEEAAQAYREELARSPRDLPAALSLSRLEGRLGRPAEQERVLRAAIRANPKSPGPYLVLALTFLQREERYAEAIELAELALDQDPQGQELQLAYFLLADLHNRLGHPQLEAHYAELGRAVEVPGQGGSS